MYFATQTTAETLEQIATLLQIVGSICILHASTCSPRLCVYHLKCRSTHAQQDAWKCHLLSCPESNLLSIDWM